MAVLKECKFFTICKKCGYKKAKIVYKPIINTKQCSVIIRVVECPKCGYKNVPKF